MRANILAATVTLILAVGFTAPIWCAEKFDAKSERIDGLRLGLSGKTLAVDLSCGQPRMSKATFEAATGLYVQDWGLPECGITLHMASERKGGTEVIASITVTAPSHLATSREIHIGSTEDDVSKAYGTVRDDESSTSGEMFVAGSIYDGLVFTLKNRKVVKIFLGAAAE